RFDDLDGVLAGGAADIELYGGAAVRRVQRILDPCDGVLGVSDVRDPHRRAVDVRYDDVVELIGGVDAPHRAQTDFPFSLLERPAGNFDVLLLNGVAHLIDRQAARVQLLDVDDDMNFTWAIAADRDGANAVHRLQGALDLLVGD